MARLWQCGAEENTLANGVEIGSSAGAGITITTATVRSGTYAFSFKTTGANSAHIVGGVIDATNVVYVRCYVNVVTAPTTACRLMDLSNDNDANYGIVLNTNGSLGLWDLFSGINIQKGSNSAVLTLNQWYRVELFCDTTTLSSVTGTARLNGTQFATGTSNETGSGQVQYIGFGDTNNNTYEFYIDDIAVNDNSGASQNSWPGDEKIIHLRPNAAGDNNAWATATGGTAGAANNYTRVSEVTPDDATTFNAELTANRIDDFNIDNTPAAIGASDTINVVAIGARYTGAAASSNSSFVLRCKKAAAGTVSESSALTPANFTWRSGTLTALTYAFVLYADPDSGAWTKTTLDSAQIGYRISTSNLFNAQISTVWMSVAFTPASVPTGFASWGGSTISQPINTIDIVSI